jgi:hypothetical protein
VAAPASALGPIGYYLLVLGAGIILDADRTWLAAGVMTGGILCLLAARR